MSIVTAQNDCDEYYIVVGLIARVPPTSMVKSGIYWIPHDFSLPENSFGTCLAELGGCREGDDGTPRTHHPTYSKLNVISYAQRTFVDYTAPSALRRQQPQDIFLGRGGVYMSALIGSGALIT